MISRDEFEALRASHDILRRVVERSAMRAILRERLQTEAAMAARLRQGTLTGGQWNTRSRQPDGPVPLGTPLIERMTDVMSEGQGFGAMDEEPGVTFYDLIVSHMPNGSFSQPPPHPDDDLSNINPLPGRWELVRTGTAITARSVAGGAAGRFIRFTMVAGAAGDELLLERIIRIPPSSFGKSPVGVVVDSISPDFLAAEMRLRAQFLQADGETTTGAEATLTLQLNTLDLPNTNVLFPEDGATPTDAAYVRVRIGLARAAAATSATATMDLTGVRLALGQDVMFIPNLTDPFGATGVTPGIIYKNAGDVVIAQQVEPGGSVIDLDDSIGFTPVDNIDFWVSNGWVDVLASEGFQIGEVGSVPAGVRPGFYAMYVKPDGELYGQNNAGTEVQLSGGGGGGSSAFSFFMS